MKPASIALAAAAAFVVAATACSGLKEAMSAHVDTAAKAGSAELSVDRLAKLLDEAKVPPRKDVAQAIANAWVDYELLGQSAAKGDTAVTDKQLDDALWAPVSTMKAKKYYELVSKNWGTEDTAAARHMWENGDILAASHILLLTKGATPEVKAAARKKIDALRAQATSANFAALAKANSQDTPSAARGGSLGLFAKGAMVPQFEQALVALKPGEISPVIETDYGYHIIRRPTYDEVKGQLLQASKGKSVQLAESTFVANMQKNGKIDIHSDAAATARGVIADPDAHRDDNATLATSTAGNFTAAELSRWMSTFPPQAQAQQRGQLANAPDSIVVMFVKNFITNDLVLHAADSAKVGPTPDEMKQLHNAFFQSRDAAWAQLGVDPKSLADSGKTESDRVRIASARVEKYMDALVGGQAQFIQVPEPVARVLRDKQGATVNAAGLDRAVERAVKTRTAADSTARAGAPATAVPMPGGQAPQGGQQMTAPPASRTQPANPTPKKP
ncbi:MAG: peptidylprolyl isomerase [Gemmatimonadota bacterium]|nr:peptidylprolyl isomerase [Gemmatimonadota bacterium]